MQSAQTLLAIGSGGFLGAILRYVAQILLSSNSTLPIPIATLFVNVVGSFLLGILYAIFLSIDCECKHLKEFLTIGLLGAFTTYSTFALDTFLLFEEKALIYATINIFLNLLGSLFALFLGYKVVTTIEGLI